MVIYGNAHRLFLQSILSKGIMNVTDVREILSELGADSKDQIFAFVRAINDRIAPQNLEIRKGIEEEDGQHFYVLVSTVETPISRLSPVYTPREMELFKKLIEAIVENDGKIGSLAALNLTDKLEKRMGKEEAQDLFNRLEEDKRIRKNSNGKISLSVRTMMELEQYLKEVHGEFIKPCNICSKICLLGDHCANCGTKFHFRCLNVLHSKHQGNEKLCPNCKAPWGQVVLS